jgi:hypothetical protein
MSNSKAKEYRERAEECDWQAATCRDADIKLQFLKVARHWRGLETQAALEER